MRFLLLLALALVFLAASISAADLIDINHASAAELRTLPGIREAYATTIIRHRPYKNKTQLRKYLPFATYKQIHRLIVAKQDD